MPLDFQSSKEWPRKVSAGGVVYRVSANGTREYGLLYRTENNYGADGDSYHLPKGTIEEGETIAQAAEREINEEAGVSVEIIHFLTGVTLELGTREHDDYPFTMTTLYFLTAFQQNTAQGMDSEHDEFVWKSPQEAIELLSMIPKQEEEIIKLAEEYFEKVDNGTFSK